MFQSIGKIGRWLLQEESAEPRRASRLARPEIIVHYWDGAAPDGREIRDISETGAYILTDERWYPGTIIRLIFQRQPTIQPKESTPAPATSICVLARVVRPGEDGVAIEFIFNDARELKDFQEFLAGTSRQAASMPSTSAAARRKGQALVELALITPLIFLLTVNTVNFGGFIFAWITVANAARSGAQYMVMSSASPGNPTPATSAQVTALVTSDIASLLNKASLVVATCTNATTSANGCTALSDPEAPTYTLATVDVTYTYQPFIPLFSFPKLGISATLPSTSIHRKAVMRMLQ